MLGASFGYSLVHSLGGAALGFWVALLLASIAVGLVGLLVETLILRRLYKAPELFQLIATFGVILIVQDVAFWYWGAENLLGPRAPGLTGTRWPSLPDFPCPPSSAWSRLQVRFDGQSIALLIERLSARHG